MTPAEFCDKHKNPMAEAIYDKISLTGKLYGEVVIIPPPLPRSNNLRCYLEAKGWKVLSLSIDENHAMGMVTIDYELGLS